MKSAGFTWSIRHVGVVRLLLEGCFHQSFHTTLIMFFPFHWTQTNPPEVTGLIEEETFPSYYSRLSQKPMCQNDLPGVFRISLWRWILWKKKWKATKFRYPPYFISSIHTLHLLCNVMWPWPCIRYKNACTIHKHKINTPWTQSGNKYLTYLHPCWKYKSIWIASDTFPTLTP